MAAALIHILPTFLWTENQRAQALDRAPLLVESFDAGHGSRFTNLPFVADSGKFMPICCRCSVCQPVVREIWLAHRRAGNGHSIGY